MSLWSNSKLLRQSGWLIMAEFVSRILAFVSVVWLINYLSHSDYAQFSYASALANIITILADFGLSTYLIKVIAKQRDQFGRHVQELLAVKFILFSVAFTMLVLVAWLNPHIPATVILVGGSSILLSNIRMFIEALYRSVGRMVLETITKIIPAVIFAGLVLWAIMQQASLTEIVWYYWSAATIGLVLAFSIVQLKVAPLGLTVSKQRFKAIMIGAWPFAISIACNYLFNYEDSALLGALGHLDDVATYTAAYKPIFFLTALAGMIINAYFPTIARQHADHNPHLQRTIQQLFSVNVSLALPLAVGGTMVAPQLISLLYKADYAPATLAFQILLWGTASIYLWAALGNTMQACDYQARYTKIFVIGVMANTVLNLALIPEYSLYGAALATAVTQLLLLGMFALEFKRRLAIPVWGYLWRPALAASVMGLVLVLLHLPLFYAIAVGVLAYGSILLVLGGIDRTLWRD